MWWFVNVNVKKEMKKIFTFILLIVLSLNLAHIAVRSVQHTSIDFLDIEQNDSEDINDSEEETKESEVEKDAKKDKLNGSQDWLLYKKAFKNCAAHVCYYNATIKNQTLEVELRPPLL